MHPEKFSIRYINGRWFVQLPHGPPEASDASDASEASEASDASDASAGAPTSVPPRYVVVRKMWQTRATAHVLCERAAVVWTPRVCECGVARQSHS